MIAQHLNFKINHEVITDITAHKSGFSFLADGDTLYSFNITGIKADWKTAFKYFFEKAVKNG